MKQEVVVGHVLPRTRYLLKEESLGAAPLRFSRVRVFGPATRFVLSINCDQPRNAPIELYMKKPHP